MSKLETSQESLKARLKKLIKNMRSVFEKTQEEIYQSIKQNFILDEDQITDISAKYISKTVKINHALNYIKLGGNQITDIYKS